MCRNTQNGTLHPTRSMIYQLKVLLTTDPDIIDWNILKAAIRDYQVNNALPPPMDIIVCL